MSKKQGTCYDAVQLNEFLREQLSEADELSIVHHLDQCTECQRALERVAAKDESVWSVLKDNFRAEHAAGHTPETTARTQMLDSVRGCLGPTDNPEMLGRLGPYEVCGIVGRGSTGIVLKALEPRLNRFVAIKILSPNFAGNGSARVRFEREARAIAAVAHEHVVPVFAVDEFRNQPYLVMQFAAGGSLQQRIDKQGPLGPEEVVRIGMQVASGLAAAHEQGIVHRDVKPANVMLESSVERAMVTDFGLARVLNDASLTHSGVITGTPQFMSPEQARGEYVDHRSDLFSLGSLMYAASTGRPPFRSETVYGVIRRVCETEMRPIREINPDIPDWLAQFIKKLCSKDREQRFQTATEVRDVLSRELAHLQSPYAVAQPTRNWCTPKPLQNVSALSTRWLPLLGCVAVLALMAGSLSPAFRGGIFSQPNRSQTITPPIADLPVFESTLTRALPVDPRGRLRFDVGHATVQVLPSECSQLDIRVVRRVAAADREAATALLARHQLKLSPDEHGLFAEMLFDGCNAEELTQFAEFKILVFVPEGYGTEFRQRESWSQPLPQGPPS